MHSTHPNWHLLNDIHPVLVHDQKRNEPTTASMRHQVLQCSAHGMPQSKKRFCDHSAYLGTQAATTYAASMVVARLDPKFCSTLKI